MIYIIEKRNKNVFSQNVYFSKSKHMFYFIALSSTDRQSLVIKDLLYRSSGKTEQKPDGNVISELK